MCRYDTKDKLSYVGTTVITIKFKIYTLIRFQDFFVINFCKSCFEEFAHLLFTIKQMEVVQSTEEEKRINGILV